MTIHRGNWTPVWDKYNIHYTDAMADRQQVVWTLYIGCSETLGRQFVADRTAARIVQKKCPNK